MVSKPAPTPSAVTVKAPVAKSVPPVQPKQIAKPVAKAVAKPAAKKVALAVKQPAVVKRPVKPVAPKAVVVKPAATKPTVAKVKKPKLVRDSFTMPKDEYVVIESLKVRSGKLGQSIKKSELLRAGIKVLATLSDIQFKAALCDVPALKTGRPKHVK